MELRIRKFVTESCYKAEAEFISMKAVNSTIMLRAVVYLGNFINVTVFSGIKQEFGIGDKNLTD